MNDVILYWVAPHKVYTVYITPKWVICLWTFRYPVRGKPLTTE